MDTEESSNESVENKSEEPIAASVEKAEIDVKVPSCSPSQRWRQLDLSVVQLWSLSGWIGCGSLLLIGSAGLIALWLNTPAPRLVLCLLWLALACFFYLQAIWLPPRKYEAWSFFLSSEILELRFGVIWRKSVLIPISRLQHVDLHRGPLERRLGLSTLEVHTAGTRNASHQIPGLPEDEAIELRDELVRKAKLEQE